MLGAWGWIQELGADSAPVSRGLSCHLEGEPWVHVPALAACLASFCESHTHPGGHFSLRIWLDSSETEPPSNVPCSSRPHTLPRFSSCLRLPQHLRRPRDLPRGQASRGWNMSIQETGPIPHRPHGWAEGFCGPSGSIPWDRPLAAAPALTLFLQTLDALSRPLFILFSFLETDWACNSGWPRTCCEDQSGL